MRRNHNKILLVGSNSKYAIEKFYFKELNQQGFDVRFFDSRSDFNSYYNKSVINKLIYRFGFSSILQSINTKLRREFDNFSPDLVLVFKGMEIYPKTLQYFKLKGSMLVNYNPDHPFIFHGRGSGNKNVEQSIELYDLYATYSKKIQREIEENYKIKSYYLPFGYDSDTFLKVAKATEVTEVNAVCFVGVPDRYRANFLSKIIAAGLQVHVYGPNWGDWLDKDKNLTIHKAVYDYDFIRILRKYRVQLNLMRPHNKDSHNMRSFEIPAAGGIMLAPITEEHMLFFENKYEAFFFDSFENCLELMNKIQKMSIEESMNFRTRAIERCQKSDYSYQEIIKIFGEHLAAKLIHFIQK